MKVKASLAELIADLDRPEKPLIRAATDALVRVAAESTVVSDALNALLSDAKRRNRWAVAYVLGQLPGPAADVVAALLDGLDHQEADIRWAIGLLLVRLAKETPSIAAALLRLCREGTPRQRRLAVYCVRDLGLQDTASRRSLIAALRDEDSLVRIAAAGSLRRRTDLERDDHEALLKSFLEDPDVRVRSVAALSLAQQGCATEVLFQALNREANSGNEGLRRAAAAALALLENKRAAPSGN